MHLLTVILVTNMVLESAHSVPLTLVTAFRRKCVQLRLKTYFIFNHQVNMAAEMYCGLICLMRRKMCRAFRLTKDEAGATVCQTFEFDKCDHMLNEAGCTRYEWAFVRAQDGLPLGQLCSDGFRRGYLGSTYKTIDASGWSDGLNKCNSEPGQLTKYADGQDRAEVDHFHTLKDTLNGDLENNQRSFFVGGFRTLGFYTGTWYWHACNTTFLPEVWGSNQPNGAVAGASKDEVNEAEVWYSNPYGLDDVTESQASIIRALCECLDPFA